MSILENDEIDFSDLDIFKFGEKDLSKVLFKLIQNFTYKNTTHFSFHHIESI